MAKKLGRLKPLSLYPLKLEDALKAALATPPPSKSARRTAKGRRKASR